MEIAPSSRDGLTVSTFDPRFAINSGGGPDFGAPFEFLDSDWFASFCKLTKFGRPL